MSKPNNNNKTKKSNNPSNKPKSFRNYIRKTRTWNLWQPKALNIPRNTRQMRSRLDSSTIEYYRALLDPEYAARRGMEVKLPSPYDTPSKCLHLINTWTFRPNDKGAALITWRPNFLMTQSAQDNFVRQMLNDPMKNKVLEGLVAPSTRVVADSGYPGKSVYSQITLNNTADLDGEGNSGLNGNVFLPMKSVPTSLKKYRLVSAKLKIQYQGRRDQKSGRLVYGQYCGDLKPVGLSTIPVRTTDSEETQYLGYRPLNPHANHYADTEYLTLIDNSEEMQKFQQFDKITSLSYPGEVNLERNNNAVFYFYPIDDTSKQFQFDGGYGDVEHSQQGIYVIDRDTTEHVYDIIPVSHTAFQNDIYLNYIDQHNGTQVHNKTIHLQDSSDNPHITVPTFVIAIKNQDLNATSESQCFNMTLYENYEAIFDDKDSIFGNTPPSKANPEIYEKIAKSRSQQQNKELTNKMVEEEIDRAINNNNRPMVEPKPSNMGGNFDNNKFKTTAKDIFTKVIAPAIGDYVKSRAPTKKSTIQKLNDYFMDPLAY